MAKSAKYKVDTWRTAKPNPGEDYTGQISLTVPNQVMSIAEIMDKHNRGLMDLPEADLLFINDEEIPNIEVMSRIDQLQYAAELRRLVATRRAEYEKLVEAGKKPPKDLSALGPQGELVPPNSVDPPEDSETLP